MYKHNFSMTEIIDSLEVNIIKLIQKLERLEDENKKLRNQLIISNEKLITEALEKKSLVENFESLKLANTLLGSDENKRETKLKINLLIREIDYCIAQLSE